MTGNEGIIQKIIKEIVLDQPATWYHRSTFITLESKLITEIKRLNRHHTRHNGQQFYAVSLKALIGDNQK